MAFTGNILEFENGLQVGKDKAVRPPSTYKVQTSDIDLNSNRSNTGYMTRNRVRGGATAAYTVTVTWDRLTWEELVVLIAAGENASFQLTCLDPKAKGGHKTGTFYRDANMTYEMTKIYEEDEAYWTTSMAFVEL